MGPVAGNEPIVAQEFDCKEILGGATGDVIELWKDCSFSDQALKDFRDGGTLNVCWGTDV